MSPRSTCSDRSSAGVRAGCQLVFALALALAPACGGSAPFRTTSELDEAPRKPDGIALDPLSAPPPPRASAGSADGIVVLRAPLGVDQALAVVRELFEAVLREDLDAVHRLFTPDATFSTGSSAPSHGYGYGYGYGGPGYGASTRPRDVWSQRMARLDYGRLSGETLYRENEISIGEAAGTDGSSVSPGRAPAGVDEADPPTDEVMLHVPVAMPKLGADRFFGPDMTLYLRRSGDRYLIYKVVEDFL